ncbi:SixA phosphatase family protein [Sphingomonas quercus]|uniref:Histidine phosphatase family protein n=1 Tax=Sphingomonas quercus TaxID=2842451 RepID=A0ABS6BLK4_9SPHN|nr:histidine phosphatase family protein [Sphingomonas quercus]MBU3078129.1 histidine phosphatase family protein [Sphingomonas quercus]
MKRLTLFRHAKSGWDDPAARDFDRPLNEKGRRAARIMGRMMRDERMRFDRVIASPAVRVAETLDAMAEGFGQRLSVAWDQRIYLAAAETLLELVRETPADVEELLLSGHNPGLEDLILLLVPDTGDAMREAVEEKFPTAALATIALPLSDWRHIRRGEGTLARFVRPRDIDPALGPGG